MLKDIFSLSRFLFISIFLIISFSLTAQWTQMGSDIDGESGGNESGWSVSMPDASTIAIGARSNNGNGSNAGHVRIYQWSGTVWTQKGSDIDGEAGGDYSGWSVSMPNTNTVAIGSINNDGNGIDAGHVRIYKWSGATWIQKGTDIDGEAANDKSGYSVSMPDTNTIAIGGVYNDGNGTDAGHVRIYKWTGSAWVQKGLDIDGEAANDQSGWTVSMPDSNTVAIGAARNDGIGTSAGHVRIYTWSGIAWIQKGTDIDGEATADLSGYSVSMPDSNTVAVAGPYNDGNGTNAGHVRIYTWSGAAWTQKGMDIEGEAAVDIFGHSISMPDVNTLAIGAFQNDGNGSNAGHVRVYKWRGTAWTQLAMDIDGEAAADRSGWSVSMPDTNTLAIGAPSNAGNGGNSGHVRIYNYSLLTNISQEKLEFPFSVMPNPSEGVFTVMTRSSSEKLIQVNDLTGKLIKELTSNNEEELIDLKDFPEGIYFLRVGEAVQKVVVSR